MAIVLRTYGHIVLSFHLQSKLLLVPFISLVKCIRLDYWVNNLTRVVYGYFSLRSRRLEVVGTKKQRASPSRAPVLSFARYFQAPATQAIDILKLATPANGLFHNRVVINSVLLFVTAIDIPTTFKTIARWLRFYKVSNYGFYQTFSNSQG